MTHDIAAFQDTDDAEAIKILAAMRHCADSWDGSARLVGNVRARDISRACTEAIAALHRPPSDRLREALETIRDDMLADPKQVAIDALA